MNCSHPYLRKLSPGESVCIECGVIVKKTLQSKDEAVLVMPPVIYELTPRFWAQIRPWSRIAFEIAKKYGWYVSMLYGKRFLIMPVLEKDEPVFYSARCLEMDSPKKYKYTTPKDVRRRMWTSGSKGKHLLIGEGVADAAYLSQLGPSCALLGSYGELNQDGIVTVMDGDIKGIEAAFKIVQDLRKKGHVDAQAVMLPVGKDPTDLSLTELRYTIKKQTRLNL